MKLCHLAMALALSASTVYAEGAYALSSAPTSAKAAQQSLPINLNTVDLTVLSHAFKGIGEKRAVAIIAYRDAHHGFKDIEELANVKGIGKRFVSVNLDALKKTFKLRE